MSGHRNRNRARDIRHIPYTEMEPFLDDAVDWALSHLTTGQRAVAAQTLLHQLQGAVEMVSDLRIQLVGELRDDGRTIRECAAVLGVGESWLKTMLRRSRSGRRAGGLTNNESARRDMWGRIKREYGQTAAERRANGFESARWGGNTGSRSSDG